MPKITINDQTFEVDAGKTIIQAAADAGIQIPHYCYHPDLGVEGSCRMCLVEVVKAPKLMPACATPVADGMVLRTDTPRVHEAVRHAMEFLLLHHPIDCPVCDQSGECWLQDYYMEHAQHDSRYPLGQKQKRLKAEEIGPLVMLDRERCILCTRCVRFTRKVTETNELQVFGRGHKAEIGTFENRPFDNPYSANVVDICPVGALTNADFRFKVRSWFLQGTESVCAGCSTGCNLRIDHSARAMGGGIPGYSATEGQIYRTVGRRNPQVNRSWLCDEGRLSFHTLERWRRTLAPGGEDGPGTWEGVVPAIHHRFEAIRREHGDSAVVALGSATNTNEALFLLKKYFKGFVDFRLGREMETYQEQQDDLLRRYDKHPNTQGAIDLGLNGTLGGLRGIRERAEKKEIRAALVSFHPQLVGEDKPETIAEIIRLLEALEFSVLSTPFKFDWNSRAMVVLPMAAWSEEQGTYTNYAGRVQMTQRAVRPPGDALPLQQIMARLLGLAPKAAEPHAVFEWLGREAPAYGGLDYDAIGPLGCPVGVLQSVGQEVAP